MKQLSVISLSVELCGDDCSMLVLTDFGSHMWLWLVLLKD